MRIELRHHLPDHDLAFDWDPETGAFSGPGGAEAERMARRLAGKTATLYGTQGVDTPDPLHNPADLAAVLADYGYRLPPDLAALLPPPEPIPDDAVA